MIENLKKILNDALIAIDKCLNVEEIGELRKELLGKKSTLGEISKNMGNLSPEERKEVGIKLSEIKNTLNAKLDAKEEELINAKSVLDEPIDLTIPGNKINAGTLHPLTQMCYDLNDAFLSLGFEVFSEDDTVFHKEQEVIWICRNCGHVYYGKDALKVCPVCNHPESYMELKATNY